MVKTMTGEATLPAARPKVWALLNDPAVLKACIPGCQLLERSGDNGFVAVGKVKIGPVAATFKGKVDYPTSSPKSATPSRAKARAASPASPKAPRKCLSLTPKAATRLHYDVEAHVGGKMAQLEAVAQGAREMAFATTAKAGE